jgi:hypothetical protein
MRFVVAFAVALCASDASTPHFSVRDRVGVSERTRPDAEACLVHFHGNEVPAREVMFEVANGRCVNVLSLDDVRSKVPWGDDRIPLPSATDSDRACTVNPNRVLTPAAFEHRIRADCDDDATARAALRSFLDSELLPALDRCRAGARALPVITFHNNSRLTVGDLDAARAVTVKGRESDILFVTRADDYQRLAALGAFSVALQNSPPADDGSLSVLYQRERYINVEAQIAPANKTTNRAMAEAALASVGALRCGPDAPATKEARP